mmetsp:Transcript_25541/g.49954  ORF Transcript_25541/g.49954 Transcript_25541/m.49954 type:complete len:221 (+) Transcript_25541:392-1054(+)
MKAEVRRSHYIKHLCPFLPPQACPFLSIFVFPCVRADKQAERLQKLLRLLKQRHLLATSWFPSPPCLPLSANFSCRSPPTAAPRTEGRGRRRMHRTKKGKEQEKKKRKQSLKPYQQESRTDSHSHHRSILTKERLNQCCLLVVLPMCTDFLTLRGPMLSTPTPFPPAASTVSSPSCSTVRGREPQEKTVMGMGMLVETSFGVGMGKRVIESEEEEEEKPR